MCVYSAVVNNGPGPVSPWSLYIGPSSTETPTTETTTVRCRKKQMNLFNKYLLLLTFETDNNYLIRFEMKKTLFAQH